MIDLRGWRLLLVVVCSVVFAATGASSHPSQAQSDEPPADEQCLVAVEGIGIDIRRGPSTACPVVAFWLTEVPLPVIGQAQSGGEWWWQLRLTRIEQAWVPQRDVIILTEEACQRVEVVPAPRCRVWTPVRRVPQPPAEPTPRGWGACGSCSTCGYDPYECVLSPEGACLWDPATCHVEEENEEEREEACIPESDVIICSETPDEVFTCPGDSRCPIIGSEYPPMECYRSACYDSCGAFAYWTGTSCPAVPR